MEKNQQHPNQMMTVANYDPAVIYGGASKLILTESEMKALSAPFDDMEYEIRPDGFIYLPQAIALKRLNDVIGIGRWGLLLINNGKDEIGPDQFKVFYDGALVIRDCFVSRSIGEAQYSRTNKNQSWASAFESAKTDCRQRCCKDIGIANDAWNPTFMRRWQKEHAKKVYVDNKGKKEIVWRRKDIDAFWNELGDVPNSPTVPEMRQQQQDNNLPWLNQGPEYDAMLKALLDGTITMATIKATRYRVAKATEEALIILLKNSWIEKCADCKDMIALTALYNNNKGHVDSQQWLKDVFNERRSVLQNNKHAVA